MPTYKKALLSLANIVALGLLASPIYAQYEIEEIEEIVVTGSIQDALLQSREFKRNSSGVVDAIISTDIAKFPDENLGEALQRLPGVTVLRTEEGQGGTYSVRGLGPDFTKTLVNGMSVPSTGVITGSYAGGGGGGRGLDVQAFSADLFQSAIVYKTYSAEIAEGGIAGTVMLETASPFDYDGQQVVFSAKASEASRAEETDPGLSFLYSNTFADDKFGLLFAINRNERTARTDDANQARANYLSRFPSVGDNSPLSNVLGPELPRTITFYEQLERTGFGLVLQGRPTEDFDINLNYLSANLERQHERHSMGAWLRGNWFTGDQDLVNPVVADGAFVSGTFTNTIVWTDESRVNRETDFHQVVLDAEWRVSDDWTVSGLLGASTVELSTPVNLRPYAALVTDVFVSLENDNFPVFTPANTSVTDPTGWIMQRHRNQSSQSEDSVDSFSLNAERLFDDTGLTGINFGVQLENKEVKLDRYRTQFGNQNFIDAGLPVDLGFANVTRLISDQVAGGPFLSGESLPDGYIAQNFFTLDFDAVVALYEQANSTPGSFPGIRSFESFEVGEDTTAFYAKFDFEYDLGGMPLVADVGLRYVETDQQTTSQETDPLDVNNRAFVTRNRTYNDTLPSLNARLEFNDEWIGRLSYSKVINRPTITSLPAFLSIDSSGFEGSGGNPELEPFRADRYDLALEYYFGEAGLVALTFFHYDVESFIQSETEMEYIPELVGGGINGNADGNVNVTRPRNGTGGSVNGFEFSTFLPFTFLPIEGFGSVFNYTSLDSGATNTTFTGFPAPLPLLTDKSWNAVLYYENDKFNARFAYSQRSEYLLEVTNGFPEFLDDRGQLDFSARYNINDNWQLTFDGMNLTKENQTGTVKAVGGASIDNGNMFFERRLALGVRATF
jgi:iron complex outermembrane receptor protein|tara:strand:- start:183 stop:2882 length:2700 start_codon:yes stop_codon:yes gene_type:complete